MRKQLYLNLIDRLKSVKDKNSISLIKTFDLWNEQIDFIEQEGAFDIPAVFIEFLPIEWKTLGGNIQQADASIRLHVVTPWKGSERDGSLYQEQALQRFDLLEQIHSCLFNYQKEYEHGNFCMFRRTSSTTNHNHDELVEDIETFTFRVMEKA